MAPWIKIFQYVVQQAPAIINFMADRKTASAREDADGKTQENLNDIYKRLDLAQKNDEELSRSIVLLEARLKKVFTWFVVVALILGLMLIIILIKIFQ